LLLDKANRERFAFPQANFANLTMAGICFLIAISLGGAALLFRQAAAEISIGTQWANGVCSLSSTFCHNPEYLAYAGGVMLVIAIGAKLGSLAN
jgi:hypothetical protein